MKANTLRDWHRYFIYDSLVSLPCLPCFKNKIKYNVFETSDKQVEWDLLSWVWKRYPQSLDNLCYLPASVHTSVQWLRIALMWDLKQLSSITGQSHLVTTTVYAPIQWLRTAVCVRPDIMSYPLSLDNVCQLNASAYAPFQWLRITLFVRPTWEDTVSETLYFVSNTVWARSGIQLIIVARLL